MLGAFQTWSLSPRPCDLVEEKKNLVVCVLPDISCGKCYEKDKVSFSRSHIRWRGKRKHLEVTMT